MEWTLVQDAESRGSGPTSSENVISVHVPKSSILLSSNLSKLVVGCLTTSMYCDAIGIFRYIQLFSGHHMVVTKKPHTPEISPCLHTVRKVCNSVLFLQRFTSRTLQRFTSRVNRSGRYSSRVESIDSLVAQGSTLCVTFLCLGTICGKEYECFLKFVDSNFFGIGPLDVNCLRDVVSERRASPR